MNRCYRFFPHKFFISSFLFVMFATQPLLGVGCESLVVDLSGQLRRHFEGPLRRCELLQRAGERKRALAIFIDSDNSKQQPGS
jgi:hypothetical protein